MAFMLTVTNVKSLQKHLYHKDDLAVTVVH